jgi:hypothetical protein
MATKIIRGPCRVYQGGVDMGYVESDIELNDEPQYVEGKVTCFGDGAFDKMKNGAVVTMAVPFTMLTSAALVKLGGTEVGGQIVFSCEVGDLCRTEAEEIILKPCVDQNPSIDPTEWSYLYHGFPERKFALAYGAAQRVYNIEYYGYASLVSGQVGRHYSIGANG